MPTPSHKVTDENKVKVSALKSFGNTNEDIAKYLGISPDTLTRFYRRELDIAQTHANAEVANKLYKKAVKEEDLSAIIFWLKTRARWRTEDNRINLESSDDLNKEIKALRESLDAKNRKDY
jgi:IS30 family transposase